MTRKDLIDKAIKNNDITIEVAGSILMLGDAGIKKALKCGEITLDLAGQLLMVNK
jgi:hypothetical protein